MRVGVHLWLLRYNAHTILQAQLKQIDEPLRWMESFKSPAVFYQGGCEILRSNNNLRDASLGRQHENR